MTHEHAPRLPRAQRREQILAAATPLLARSRLVDVTLADVADEAGITRALVYRHVESKEDLYRRCVVRARSLVEAAAGAPPYDASILGRLFDVAAAHPDEFRLLFAQAPREPAAADIVEDHQRSILGTATSELTGSSHDRAVDQWTQRLVPELTLIAITTWLDTGEPSADVASTHLLSIIERALSTPLRS